MTYAEIQKLASRKLGVKPSSVSTCWIAEVKRSHGLTTRRAPNAGKGEGADKCLDEYWKAIEEVMGL
jgi:hypothetical protein